MSERKILVGASVGITHEGWMRRKIHETLSDGDLVITQIGDNKLLNNILSERDSSSASNCISSNARRSDIHKALSENTHLVLFWDGRSLTNVLFEARIHGIPTKVFAIEVTEVVNKDRGDPFDVYIGRGTPWGNPYPVGKQEGQYERDEAIDLYKLHFEKTIISNVSLRKGLLGMRGLRIACHCKPLACHGDVIAKYLNSIDPDDVC